MGAAPRAFAAHRCATSCVFCSAVCRLRVSEVERGCAREVLHNGDNATDRARERGESGVVKRSGDDRSV